MKISRSAKGMLAGLVLVASGITGSKTLEPYRVPQEQTGETALRKPFGASHDTLESKLHEELLATQASLRARDDMVRIEDIYGPGIRWGLERRGKHLGVLASAAELAGLPADLAIKPFIESSGKADAASTRRTRSGVDTLAVGMFQLSVSNDSSLRAYLAEKGISYEHTDWLTQMGASYACSLFDKKAAGDSPLASQVIYVAGAGNYMRLMRDGKHIIERRFGDLELPAIAYALIARPVTEEVAKKTNGSFRDESSDYMLKFAAFIPAFREALNSTAQEPVFRYIVRDSLDAQQLSERTGIPLELVRELNEHELGFGAVFNSPVPLTVHGLAPAKQLQDISAEELALTQQVINYRSPVTVPDTSFLAAAKAHNEWRRNVAAAYERAADRNGSLYGHLMAWGGRNCGVVTVPGQKTEALEKNKQFTRAFSAALPKYLTEVDGLVRHFTRSPNVYRGAGD